MNRFEPAFLPFLVIALAIGFQHMKMEKPVLLAMIMTCLIAFLALLDRDFGMGSSIIIAGVISGDLLWQFLLSDVFHRLRK